MMGDYISRDAVLAQKGDCYDKDGHLLYAVGTGNILRIPAADVVGVVRCRECKHHDGIRCFRWNSVIVTRFDDYCSNGERKDGGQDDV